MSRSLSETPSAPFKAMLSHNRPRHIRLANAAVSSNFVSLQSRWARYLKSSSPFAEEVNEGPRRGLSPFFVGLFGDGEEI